VDADNFGDSRVAVLFLREREERADSVHCRKRGGEAKYWLDVYAFEAIEPHAFNMSPADKRTVRRIIFEHFDYILSEWRKFQEKQNG